MKHKYNMLGSLMGEEDEGNDQVLVHACLKCMKSFFNLFFCNTDFM